MAPVAPVVTPCFTPGTPIATDRGLRPIEALRQGDRVVTRDNGLRRIAWVGRRDVSFAELVREEALRPVLVSADAFGPGRPSRDLLVSPSHRFLVGRDLAQQHLAEPEALVAAEHLIDNRRIRRADALGVSYLHILLDRHQVILAGGAWTESFHPDDQVMRGLGNRQRLEITALFPDIETVGASARFPAARPVLGPEA